MTATKVLTSKALEKLGLGVEQVDTSRFTEIDEQTAIELVGVRLNSGSGDQERGCSLTGGAQPPRCVTHRIFAVCLISMV